jgi:geranylgeranyl pyrophosphate synthase
MSCSDEQSLRDLLAPAAGQLEADLAEWLIEPDTPDALAEAMRYCTAGGKRLRPALAYLAAESAGGSRDTLAVRRAALAVELIHVYSLVHDDLPAMDDDDLRRGRPTAHVQFGQAMAILVGDALQTRAFGLLAEAGAAAAELTAELAIAAGATGMVAGQVADMDLCTVPDGVEGLRYIQRRKTAALLRGAARMGAIAAGSSTQTLTAISDFAEALGEAFQVVDDLLDATGTSDQLGKTPGKDAQAGKKTYVTLLGLDRAEALAGELTDRATAALAPLGQGGEPLARLARLLTDRQH